MRNLVLAAAILAASPALAAVGDCTELTPLQRAAGFVTWLNVLEFASIILGVIAVGILARHWVKVLLTVFLNIPVTFYEFFGYVGSVALIAWAAYLPATDQLWPLLGGSLCLGLMLALTMSTHFKGENFTAFFTVIAVPWAVIAMAYNSDAVGFLTVLAVMAAAGFFAGVLPLCYVVGFQEGMVPRGTAAALLITVAAVLYHVSGATHANPFQAGALWIGPLVLAVGLLIMASRWYYPSHVPYLMRQLTPVAFGVLSTGIGNVWGVPHLAAIGGTFFVLYFIEKFADIPARSLVGYATVFLVASASIGSGVYWAQHHVDLIQPYLLF
jgi:hypothetical protein